MPVAGHLAVHAAATPQCPRNRSRGQHESRGHGGGEAAAGGQGRAHAQARRAWGAAAGGGQRHLPQRLAHLGRRLGLDGLQGQPALRHRPRVRRRHRGGGCPRHPLQEGRPRGGAPGDGRGPVPSVPFRPPQHLRRRHLRGLEFLGRVRALRRRAVRRREPGPHARQHELRGRGGAGLPLRHLVPRHRQPGQGGGGRVGGGARLRRHRAVRRPHRRSPGRRPW